MEKTEFKCKICGDTVHPNEWIDSMSRQLIQRTMCFQCNHWETQRLEDEKNGKYSYAIVDGGHYRLCPPTNDYFKGFGGHVFKFQFNDGTIVENNNTWFQGDIKEAHPHWREVMPDNAIILQ